MTELCGDLTCRRENSCVSCGTPVAFSSTMQRKRVWIGASIASALLACLTISVVAATLNGALPAPLPLFPRDNWWNIDISAAPVDPASANYVAFINNGGTRKLHPDFGGEASPGSVEIYGFPFIVVDGTQ